jgi:hypothetical protein
LPKVIQQREVVEGKAKVREGLQKGRTNVISLTILISDNMC